MGLLLSLTTLLCAAGPTVPEPPTLPPAPGASVPVEADAAEADGVAGDGAWEKPAPAEEPPQPEPTVAVEPAPAPSAPMPEPAAAEPPAPVLTATPANDEPSARYRVYTTIDRPTERGHGLFIGAGLTGGLGLAFKIFTTTEAVRALGNGDGFLDLDAPFSIVYGSLFYNPMIGSSLAMLGGGMGKRGKYDAYFDTVDPSASRRHMKPRDGLGWGLFGGGVGLYVATRLFALRCPTTECLVGVWEGGYYASLAMTGPGIAMAAYGTAYKRQRNRLRRVADLSVAPIGTPGSFGLSVSGRF